MKMSRGRKIIESTENLTNAEKKAYLEQDIKYLEKSIEYDKKTIAIGYIHKGNAYTDIA
jgi:hypothetical protein